MTAKAEKKPLMLHFIAGGGAGLIEALACHPLDTIKNAKKLGPFATATKIIQGEGFSALYKGLGAVVTAIVPKMAIRFSSFELYKTLLADSKTGKPSVGNTFLAGLGAGITESILVVNPMEVVKIRLQAQRHSLMEPEQVPKYRNAAHAVYTITKEEGLSTLYRGVTLTAARQATNQAVNFTLYQEFKKALSSIQGVPIDQLPSYQHLLAGGISGAIAPLCNAPIDTIKTRIQKQVAVPGESGFTRIRKCASNIINNEGFGAFYNGLTPRLLRIAPGQAITFMVYEKISSFLTPLVTQKQ